jgi:hypothetical protein
MLWKIQQRLTYLNKLITLKSTGSPKELANKLCITERAWYKLKDELINDLNWPIEYDKHRKSYVFRENVSFEMGFRKLSNDEISKLSGGKFLSPKDFICYYFSHHFFRF